MRRDTFLKSLVALAAAGGLPLSAQAAANLKMMIPANPGGGWDTTGRALGKALQEAGAAATVTYDNKGGAAGAIGLAQFSNGSKGDANALMVMGAVMLGGIITGKPPVDLSKVTPLARLTSEYNVFVVPAASPLKTMKDVVEQLRRDPGSVKWGGGSRGSTEHIAAAMIAREASIDPGKINYVAFRGGGEATAAILGGNVTVGGSGYSEFSEYIKAGKMRALSLTSPEPAQGRGHPHAQGTGYQCDHRQLAWCVRRTWHYASAAQGVDRVGREGDQGQVLAGGAGEEQLDASAHGWPGVREVRRRRIRQFARHHGQGWHGMREAAPEDDPRLPSLLQGLVGLGVIGVGLALAVGALGIPSNAGYAGVGPNFLPWLVAAGLTTCGAFMVYQARTGGFRHMEEGPPGEKPYWSGFVWMSAGLLLNAALITTIGFIFSCALCFVLASRGMRNAQGQTQGGPGAWVTDAVTGLVIAAPVYWLFTQFLAINLPGLTQSGWI